MATARCDSNSRGRITNSRPQTSVNIFRAHEGASNICTTCFVRGTQSLHKRVFVQDTFEGSPPPPPTLPLSPFLSPSRKLCKRPARTIPLYRHLFLLLLHYLCSDPAMTCERRGRRDGPFVLPSQCPIASSRRFGEAAQIRSRRKQ